MHELKSHYYSFDPTEGIFARVMNRSLHALHALAINLYGAVINVVVGKKKNTNLKNHLSNNYYIA